MSNKPEEFEIIEKKMASSTILQHVVQPEDHCNQSLLTNVEPPSELPSFVTSRISTKLSNLGTLIEIPVNQKIAVSVASESFVMPVSKVSQSLQSADHSSSIVTSSSTIPVTCQPISPTSTTTSLVEKDVRDAASQDSNWLGWIKETVHAVGSKVAERAKSSMDTMITTLDPQMKDVLHSGGDIDIIVASNKEVKVNAVREAFQFVFGKATVHGLSSLTTGVASQPVGFDAALNSAEERINNIRNSGEVHHQQPVIAVEGFITEFGKGSWMELSILLLDDPYHDVILKTFTQPTPIPSEFIKQAQDGTPLEYSLIMSGYSVTIGSVAAQCLNVDHSVWHETLTEVSRRDTILLAAKSLAGLYRARLPDDII